jgi:hypothetical protein
MSACPFSSTTAIKTTASPHAMHTPTAAMTSKAERLSAFVDSPQYSASFKRAITNAAAEKEYGHEVDTFAEAHSVMNLLQEKIKAEAEQEKLEASEEQEFKESLSNYVIVDSRETTGVEADQEVEEIAELVNKLEFQDSAVSVGHDEKPEEVDIAQNEEIHVAKTAEIKTKETSDPSPKDPNAYDASLGPAELPFTISIAALPQAYIQADLRELRDIAKTQQAEYFDLVARQEAETERIGAERIAKIKKRIDGDKAIFDRKKRRGGRA